MPPRHSKELLSKIANTVFLTGNDKEQRQYFLTLDRKSTYELIPNESKRLKIIKEIAFQERAESFKKLLKIFEGDEKAILAIVRGYEADVRHNNSYDPGDPYSSPGDKKDLRLKAAALQDFLSAAEKEFQKTNGLKPPRM